MQTMNYLAATEHSQTATANKILELLQPVPLYKQSQTAQHETHTTIKHTQMTQTKHTPKHGEGTQTHTPCKNMQHSEKHSNTCKNDKTCKQLTATEHSQTATANIILELLQPVPLYKQSQTLQHTKYT
jgi:predicted  nucleic acid-binding Zn ribbon protein